MANAVSGIKMTKKNRLTILLEARKILSNPSRWTTGILRRKVSATKYQYCLLGACEEAAYRTKLAPRPRYSFDGAKERPLGYILSEELSLKTYSLETKDAQPHEVNDQEGYLAVMELLDGYIKEVKAGKAREPKGS